MIDQKTLDHLAHLARIAVLDSEKEQLAQDITNMVGFIDVVQKIPLSSQADVVFTQNNVARTDDVHALESVYNLVEAAPDHADGFVKVPKIIG